MSSQLREYNIKSLFTFQTEQAFQHSLYEPCGNTEK